MSHKHRPTRHRPALFALACLALLALPAAAAATPGIPANALTEACPINHFIFDRTYYCDSEFTLRASNGYRITVSGEVGSRARDAVTLGAERGNAAVDYFGHGTVTPTSIDANFGRLGGISVHFRPSGKVRRIRVKKSCITGRLPVVKARLGTFLGKIRFRGEQGYTTLSARQASGGIGDPLAISPATQRCETPKQQGAISLNASIPRGGVGFLASTEELGPKLQQKPTARPGGYFFLALTYGKAEGVTILRAVGALGPPGDFIFDNALSSATVTPPAPFTGSATFQRNVDGSTTWTGSLSVPMPGLGTVALAGSKFKSKLMTSSQAKATGR